MNRVWYCLFLLRQSVENNSHKGIDMQERTLGELAEYVGGRVCGDPDVRIKSASTLSRASEGDISFLMLFIFFFRFGYSC